LQKESIMDNKNYHPQTKVLHSSYRSDKTTNSVTVPIYQTTAFEFDSAEHAANLFALKEGGNIYTRLTNPTCEIFEKRMADLHGGTAALAVSSGQTATMFSVLNLCEKGDNFVSSTDLYGGSHTLFSSTFKKMGIEVRFADPKNPENFKELIDEKTRCIYAETLPNPKLEVFPISEVAKIANSANIPLIMDNTCAPIICNPFDFGASIIVYSTTKYIGGHGTSLGGMIIESGDFDWKSAKDTLPLLNEPDESYHGIVWSDFEKSAYIIKARSTLLRDVGGAMSPFNAFSFIQGLETLPLRMRAHCENATKIASFLENHPKVLKVIHPSVMSGVAKQRADKYLCHGQGALMGIELKGGIEAGRKFIDNLKLFYHVANIGDARSLAIHPATTTHQQLTKEEQLASGVTEGYVRLSIGIEYPEDLIADLTQALEKA
jgi:O-acetylhomoserine (thiol)-lyase